MSEKFSKAKLFDCVFVHLRQKARLRPELSRKFLSTLGPNPTQKPVPIYNFGLGLSVILCLNGCYCLLSHS